MKVQSAAKNGRPKEWCEKVFFLGKKTKKDMPQNRTSLENEGRPKTKHCGKMNVGRKMMVG